MPWSRPLLSLLLLLLLVRWRGGIFALPQGSPGASQSPPSALNISAMFLVQCSYSAADKTLWTINMVYNQSKADKLIVKVTPNQNECDSGSDYNRTALVTQVENNTTLQALLDHYDSSDNLTCKCAVENNIIYTNASVLMVNVTFFNVCRSSSCGGPGRPFSCGAGQVGWHCPETQGWVVQRLVGGKWADLARVKDTCRQKNWTVPDAVLVDVEDQDRLTGRIVDLAHVSEKRFAYVHPNGTCQFCHIDPALAGHSSFVGLPENGNVVVVLSVTVGVLLVIIIVLLIIVLCLYLRRGNPSRAPLWCVLRRQGLDPVGTALTDAAPSEDRQNDDEPQTGQDETECKNLLGPHPDSSVSTSRSTTDCRKSDG